MLTEPAGFDPADLVGALQTSWGIEVDDLEYVPVGFGSYHWRVTGRDRRRWFVNVDEVRTVAALDRLHRALSTAAALGESGLEFVHAPVRNLPGACVTPVGEFAVSVTSYVDGVSYEYGEYPDQGLRRAVLAALGRLHAASASVPAGLPRRDDLAVAGRGELFGALHAGGRWLGGPYGEVARKLVVGAWPRIEEMFDRYDGLVRAVASTSDGWVVTHGEPHPGNVMSTRDGILIIDWETALIAPRERDLWRVAPTDDDDERLYGQGARLDPAALALYRLRWDLSDICAFAEQLRGSHVDDSDTRLALSCLRGHLAP
jgi:hypothetical protein